MKENKGTFSGDTANNGIGEETIEERVRKYVQEEKKENAEKNFCMGMAFLNGIDVEVDRERGVKLIKEAADEGHKRACKTLSGMYTYGVGVEIDEEKAEEYMKKAEYIGTDQ